MNFLHGWFTWLEIDHYVGKSTFPTHKNTSTCGCIYLYVKCAYRVETTADISLMQWSILVKQIL